VSSTRSYLVSARGLSRLYYAVDGRRLCLFLLSRPDETTAESPLGIKFGSSDSSPSEIPVTPRRSPQPHGKRRAAKAPRRKRSGYESLEVRFPPWLPSVPCE